MAKVYLKFNAAVIKEFPLNKDHVTFGRKSDNDIVIDHPTVSGHHGRFTKEDDHFVIEDINSTNGTFINGRRIKSGRIKDRDQIGVAGHVLDFYDDDSVSIELTPVVENRPKSIIEDVLAHPQPVVSPMAPGEPLGEPPTSPSAPPEKAPDAENPTTSNIVTGNAMISIIAGGVNGQTRIPLKDTVTYIGTKESATIKIKGFFAPEVAGVITRRAEGYLLKAVKPGYITVNGVPLVGEVYLENRSRLEAGAAIMLFVKTD